MPKHKLMPLAYWGVAELAVVCAISTYQRSALIGALVLSVFMFLRSRHKLLYGTVGLVGLAALLFLTSSEWIERISAIQDYQTENSTFTRILVWRWTLDYVSTHPLGRGFQSYVVNAIVFPPDAQHPGGYTQFGRAFHSIYLRCWASIVSASPATAG